MIITEQDKQMMREAIRLSAESVKNGGGPFGAVIAKDGEIVAGTSNSVTLLNDPTAHAEVTCIREACRKLHTFDLTGYKIYTSCEPCPMCLGAIYWAHLDCIYYANHRKDAADIDFDDDFIYQELEKPMDQRSTPIISLLREEALPVFRMWAAKPDKTEY
jgi:tRNA(Arg) A34 adenosine deaminase TadA